MSLQYIVHLIEKNANISGKSADAFRLAVSRVK